MDKRILIINIVITFCDFLICALGMAVFGWAAFFFGKWWISLFGVIPLTLYSSHGLLVDSDIQQDKLEKLKPQPKEVEKDA